MQLRPRYEQSRFGLLLVVALLALNGCEGGGPEAEPSEPTAPGTVEVIPYEVVSEYRFEDRDWKVVVIGPGASENDLRALAADLRAQFPEDFIQIFDDSSQIEQFVAWRVNFPNDAFPKPEEWMNSHHVATVRRILEKGVREWQLRGGQAHPTHSGKKIVALP